MDKDERCILCNMKNDTNDKETPQLCDTCKLEIYHEVAMRNAQSDTLAEGEKDHELKVCHNALNELHRKFLILESQKKSDKEITINYDEAYVIAGWYKILVLCDTKFKQIETDIPVAKKIFSLAYPSDTSTPLEKQDGEDELNSCLRFEKRSETFYNISRNLKEDDFASIENWGYGWVLKPKDGVPYTKDKLLHILQFIEELEDTPPEVSEQEKEENDEEEGNESDYNIENGG